MVDFSSRPGPFDSKDGADRHAGNGASTRGADEGAQHDHELAPKNVGEVSQEYSKSHDPPDAKRHRAGWRRAFCRMALVLRSRLAYRPLGCCNNSHHQKSVRHAGNGASTRGADEGAQHDHELAPKNVGEVPQEYSKSHDPPDAKRLGAGSAPSAPAHSAGWLLFPDCPWRIEPLGCCNKRNEQKSGMEAQPGS